MNFNRKTVTLLPFEKLYNMYCLGYKKKLTVWRHFLVGSAATRAISTLFLIAVMILLTTLFRMALWGNLVGAKKQCSFPLVFKNCPSTTYKFCVEG